MNSKSESSVEEVVHKLEHYCSYQERCHFEVQQKLLDFSLKPIQREAIIVHLIENNYLNEERFALLFSQSKFHQKKWGKIRIKNELKLRRISDYLIQKALQEINSDDYQMVFTQLSEHHWSTIHETNVLKKRKKFCDFMLRKGWEADLVYEKVIALEKKEA